MKFEFVFVCTACCERRHELELDRYLSKYGCEGVLIGILNCGFWGF